MSEQQLVEMVQPLVDGEDVLGAGVFQPRGTSGTQGVSMGVGFGTDSSVGLAVGALGVLGAGQATAAVEHEPRWTIVGVTPTRVLAFEGLAHGIGWKPGDCYATFDRTTLAVTIHGRMNVKVMVLEDLKDHRRLELETARWGPQHGTVVVHLLADSSDPAGGPDAGTAST